MHKKKLFIVINSFESGGAERNVSYLLRHFSKRYTVYLILLKDAVFYDVPKNVTVIPLSHITHNWLLALFLPIYVIKLKILIKKMHPHVVVSFLEIANFVTILAYRDAIISFRTSLHFYEKGLIKKIHRFLIKHLYPHARAIVVNSRENADELTKNFSLSAQKIIFIPNIIDSDMIAYKSAQPINTKSFPPAKKIFITIGRLEKQKRINVLIETFTKKAFSNAILLIIGDGTQKEHLAQLIKQNNLAQNIFLLGNKKNVFPYLAYADYFLFASEAEGFPNVLIEAMMCDLPIITTDFKTGAREIIDPQLTFNQKITYPHYGLNGVLLSMDHFADDCAKLQYNKIQQRKTILKHFTPTYVLPQWEKVIDKQKI